MAISTSAAVPSNFFSSGVQGCLALAVDGNGAVMRHDYGGLLLFGNNLFDWKQVD
jgi:hypothetical protein